MTYLLNNAVALDQAVNALLGGAPDETLSARAHRQREKNHRYWGWTADAIDALLWFDKDHCRKAFESELHRRQLPPIYTR